MWFESPCYIRSFPLKDNALIEFVTALYEQESIENAYEYEKQFQINNQHYEIDCPQCDPFLPDKIKILKLLTEIECLNWFLENYK